jgi:hypothetical protein
MRDGIRRFAARTGVDARMTAADDASPRKQAQNRRQPAQRCSVDEIFLWDAAIAGQAQDRLALRLLRRKDVGPGLDLHLPGYRNLKRIAGSPHGLHGSAWIDIDKRNASRFPF